MKYRETSAKVSEQIAAIEKLEGYPRKPAHIGAAFIAAGLVPDTYRVGAIGWTDKLAEPVDAGGGDVECELPDEIVTKYAGRDVVVDGKTVRVDIRSKVAAPVDGDAKPVVRGGK